MHRCVHLRITGLVQGVAYRASACDAALDLGVHGWVRNLDNGDVEALAEGPIELVERFIVWTRRGPPAAEVSQVTVTDRPPTGEFSTFRVVR